MCIRDSYYTKENINFGIKNEKLTYHFVLPQKSSSLPPDIDHKTMVIMIYVVSTKNEYFVTLRVECFVLRCGHIGDIVNILNFIKITALCSWAMILCKTE